MSMWDLQEQVQSYLFLQTPDYTRPWSSPLPLPHPDSHGVHYLFCLMFLGICILLSKPECEPSLSDHSYASSQTLLTLTTLDLLPLFHLHCHHSFQLCMDSSQPLPSHHTGSLGHFASAKEMYYGCLTIRFTGLTMFPTV